MVYKQLIVLTDKDLLLINKGFPGGSDGKESACNVPEARRGSQGASRAAPGKSGLHACGEGERVLALANNQGWGVLCGPGCKH